MFPGSEDRLFARFCRSGDPAALAAVFDRVAPELLRVATHLVGQQALAEDLVQETFLAAIEHRDSYDQKRALRPWLVTILTNKARRLRRDEQRPLDPTRAAGDVVADPEQEVQAGEVVRTVDATIAALPEVYHPVLRLHLRQGLLAAQIAASLGRPAGTVRSQLTRGLELLRRALPAGLALGAAALLTPQRGLAAVRARVLDQIPTLHGAGSAATVAASPRGSFMTVYLPSFSLGAALLLGVASWALLRAPSAPPVRPLVDPPAAAVGATDPSRSSAAFAARTPDGNPGPPTASDPTALSVGVAFADGRAAPGISVFVSPARIANPRLREVTGVTDPCGEARFTGLTPGSFHIRCDRGGTTELTVAANTTTPARLTLARGLTVRGTVTSHGLPVAQAEVWLSLVGDQNDGSVVARTGGDGTFQLEAVPPGSFVSAWTADLPACASKQIAGKAGDRVDVDLVLTGDADTVTGRVVDGDGCPVAGARLSLGIHNGPGTFAGGVLLTGAPPRAAVTDTEGGFRLPGIPRRELPLFARAPGSVLRKQAVPVSAGGPRTIEVRLERGGAVRGRATDTSGAPLSGVFVRMATRPEWWPGPAFAESWVETGVDGSFVLDGLPAGSVELMADGRERGTTRTTLTIVAGGEARWDAVLGAGPRIAGRVVDERGQPLPAFRVGPAMPRGPGAYRQVPTDPDGRFVVTDCQPGEQRLFVHDPQDWTHDPVVVVEPVSPGAEPLTVSIPDTRRATGRLRGRAVDEHGQSLRGVRIAVRDLAWHSIREVVTDAEGEFQTGLLHPARYRVQAHRAGYPQRELGDHAVAARQELDLGTVRWEPTGALQVTARWEDATPVAGLLLVSSVNPGVQGPLTPLVAGAAQATGLPPGDYLVKVACPDAVFHEQRCTVRAQQDTPVTLTLRRGTQRWLRLLDAQDRPLPGMVGLHLVFRDAAGDARAEEHTQVPTHELSRVLPAGDGRLLVETASGLHGEVAITGLAGTEATSPIVVRLR